MLVAIWLGNCVVVTGAGTNAVVCTSFEAIVVDDTWLFEAMVVEEVVVVIVVAIVVVSGAL